MPSAFLINLWHYSSSDQSSYQTAQPLQSYNPHMASTVSQCQCQHTFSAPKGLQPTCNTAKCLIILHSMKTEWEFRAATNPEAIPPYSTASLARSKLCTQAQASKLKLALLILKATNLKLSAMVVAAAMDDRGHSRWTLPLKLPPPLCQMATPNCLTSSTTWGASKTCFISWRRLVPMWDYRRFGNHEERMSQPTKGYPSTHISCCPWSAFVSCLCHTQLSIICSLHMWPSVWGCMCVEKKFRFKKKFTTEVDSSQPEVVVELKPQLLIGSLWPVKLNLEKAATFKVSSRLAESRQH